MKKQLLLSFLLIIGIYFMATGIYEINQSIKEKDTMIQDLKEELVIQKELNEERHQKIEELNQEIEGLDEQVQILNDLLKEKEDLYKEQIKKLKEEISHLEASKPRNEVQIASLVSRGEIQPYQTLSVTATAYTAYCKGCTGVTRYGEFNLRKNPDLKIIAIDPKVVKPMSKVWVEGYGYAIAADIGSAIKGNRIDVFIPEKVNADRWGVRKNIQLKVYQ